MPNPCVSLLSHTPNIVFFICLPCFGMFSCFLQVLSHPHATKRSLYILSSLEFSDDADSKFNDRSRVLFQAALEMGCLVQLEAAHSRWFLQFLEALARGLGVCQGAQCCLYLGLVMFYLSLASYCSGALCFYL